MGVEAIGTIVACRQALLCPVTLDFSVLTFSQKVTRFSNRDLVVCQWMFLPSVVSHVYDIGE